MGRKRELVRLLRDFAQQHEDGVCRVKSFRHLLRLEYPKACKEDLKAMLDFVGTMTDFEAAATEAAKARKEEVEQIFRAIDFDASGSIDEKEFVENLLQSAQDHGMGRDALVKRAPAAPRQHQEVDEVGRHPLDPFRPRWPRESAEPIA